MKGESKRWLLIEIHDRLPKGDCLGCIELNLNNYADMVMRDEWVTLQSRKGKKDKVTGEIRLRTRVVPEVSS